MFGLGKKKEKPLEEASQEPSLPKTPLYDVNDEVVFHVMPSRFKKQNADARQAHKTGVIIMAVAGLLILGLFTALAWYFLNASQKNAAKLNPVPESRTEVATTTEDQGAADNTAAPTLNTQMIDQLATSTLAATSSPAEAATTSQATSSVSAVETGQAPIIVASSTDSDDDGLTDDEETVLLSSSEKADTDGDGFVDLAEFDKGYNPAGPGKIDAAVLGNYQNNNFSLSYPAKWQFTSSGNDAVIFSTADEQMVQVSLQPNVNNQTIVEWYRTQFGNQDIAPSQYINQVDLGGNAVWQGIFSPDRLTVYLMNERKQTIASINYNPGFSRRLNYPQIFAFMIDSFVLKN